jgi:hypothetical protein
MNPPTCGAGILQSQWHDLLKGKVTMKITPMVREISNLAAGDTLDRRLAIAMNWGNGFGCPQESCRLEKCTHVPKWSQSVEAALDLRREMSKRNWDSEDRWSDVGNTNGHFTYMVWFKLWDPQFIEYVSFGHGNSLDEMPVATARAALLCFEAHEDCCVGNREHILRNLKANRA